MNSNYENYSVTGPVKEKGDRLLGITMEIDQYEDFPLLKKSVGVNAHGIGFAWTEIETTPLKYDRDKLKRINSAYQDIEIILAVNPFETFVKTVPSDLKNKNLSDPEVIDRYKKLLDVIFFELDDLEFDSFVIGNEANVYLDESGNWENFKVFYKEIIRYVKEKDPDIKVGIAIASGFMEEIKIQAYKSHQVQEMLEISDIFHTTFYPTPGLLEESFDLLVSEIDKPIYIQEIGYPTSQELGSSDVIQAEFIKHLFEIWDKYNTKIKFINFFQLDDMDKEQIHGFIESWELQTDDAKLMLELLTTFGIRIASGQKKAGFYVLQKEAEARGW